MPILPSRPSDAVTLTAPPVASVPGWPPSTRTVPARVPPGFSIVTGTWGQYKTAARAVRHAVFVVEQNIPVELEWDEWDEDAWHAVVFDASHAAVATGRLLPPAFDAAAPATGHIGRMAVLASARRAGLGGAVLQALMQAAPARGFRDIVLHAQSYVAAFYARHGYRIEGEEFVEAGIPHRIMRARLPPAFTPVPVPAPPKGRV